MPTRPQVDGCTGSICTVLVIQVNAITLHKYKFDGEVLLKLYNPFFFFLRMWFVFYGFAFINVTLQYKMCSYTRSNKETHPTTTKITKLETQKLPENI